MWHFRASLISSIVPASSTALPDLIDPSEKIITVWDERNAPGRPIDLDSLGH